MADLGALRDFDQAGVPELGLGLPWSVNPASSWLDYRCWVEVRLDAGMVLHKPLPQSDPSPDTLAFVAIDDPHLDTNKGNGANIRARASGQDYIQRMATSTYTFILKGFALRVGYQVPIPGLMAVGSVTPVPGEVQRAYNVIVGNASGIPVWFATWELHYIVANMPSPGEDVDAPVPFNPAMHIRPDAKLPQRTQVPYTLTDQNATQNANRVPNPGFNRVP